jgi:hypothetical protein
METEIVHCEEQGNEVTLAEVIDVRLEKRMGS